MYKYLADSFIKKNYSSYLPIFFSFSHRLEALVVISECAKQGLSLKRKWVMQFFVGA